MRRVFTVCLFSLGILITACKKEGVITPESPLRVKTKTDITMGGPTFTYMYDAQGSIAYSLNSMAPACRYDFLYTGNSITQSFFCSPSYSGVNYTYRLNTGGYIAEKLEHGTRVEYFYDAEGYIVVVNHTPGEVISSIDSITVVDGNPTEIIKTSTFDRMHNEGYITVYREQTINAYSTQINTIGNENFGMSFLGRSAKNLLVSSVTTTLSKTVCDGSGCADVPYTNTNSYDYTYEFDDLGRVTKQTEAYSENGSAPSVHTYAYTYY